MNKRLSSLLGVPEKALAKAIGQLEAKNGYPSHDVRHLAETIQKTRKKIAELGLDPDDTTAQELYHALLAKFEKDSLKFEKSLAPEDRSFEKKAETAIRLTQENVELPQRWVLKSSAAKEILKLHPPRKLMKQTGYRSIESMFKREGIASVFLNANLIESGSWQKELGKKVSRKDSTAFEMRTISLIRLSSLGIFEGASALQYNDEIGALGLVQNSVTEQMPLLSLTIMLLDSLGSSARSSQLSQELSWWSDMDGLVAELGGVNLSLDIKDVSMNHIHQHEYDSSLSGAGRFAFWQGLLARYENQLQIEEDALAGLTKQVAAIKAPIRQPAFEYVEDF